MYAMQTTSLPASLYEEIDKIVRRFLWSYNNTGRKMHHVSWHVICKLQAKGGLGLKPTRLVNQAFMMKLG